MRPTRGGGVPDQFKTKGGSMKRTMIATMAAVATVLAAAYLTGADGTAAFGTQTQHIMTNKAEAVKHAAGHSAFAQQPQADSAVLSIYSIETD